MQGRSPAQDYTSTSDAPTIIGDSAAVRALRVQVAAAARVSAVVLVTGETGTGKGLVARLIHAYGPRQDGPLISLSCSGTPDAVFERELLGHRHGALESDRMGGDGALRSARGGTLFLDDVGEAGPAIQAILLRATADSGVNGLTLPGETSGARLVVATNRDLHLAVGAGLFHEDLYYRLNGVHIVVPPLRDRGDDIVALSEHYLERWSARQGMLPPVLTPDVAQLLVAYSWPGNVRELRQVMERLAIDHAGTALTPDDLPIEIRSEGDGYTGVSSTSEVVFRAPTVDWGRGAVAHMWNLMLKGFDFWTVVYPAFKARELTRTELAALIDRGLTHTGGSYTALLKVFNLPSTDYKRFHAFLYQQRCNLPVADYRRRRPRRPARAEGPRTTSTTEEMFTLNRRLG